MCHLDPPDGFTSGMPSTVYVAESATGRGYSASDPMSIGRVATGCRPGSTVRLTDGVYTARAFTQTGLTIEAAEGHTPQMAGAITASGSGSTVDLPEVTTTFDIDNRTDLGVAAQIDNATILLRSGTYTAVTFTGAGQTIRSAAGEWAWFETSDTSVVPVTIAGAGTLLEYVGVRGAITDRVIYEAALAGGGIDMAADDVTVRGCVMMDTLAGIGWFTGSGEGGVLEDCLILDVGWNDPDTRWHGHGVYTHNEGTLRTLRRNIVWSPAASAIKTAGKDNEASNYLVQSNVCVNTRGTALSVQHYSEHEVSENCTWDDNQIWNVAGVGWTGIYLHFSDEEQVDATITDNWIRAGWGIGIQTPWSEATITGNTVAGDDICISDDNGGPMVTTRVYSGNSYYSDDQTPFNNNRTLAQWKTDTGQDADATKADIESLPRSSWVAATEEGGALIRVYNPPIDDLGVVYLSTVEVTTGMSGDWWLFDALNPFAGPVASGTGSTVTVPMTGLTVRTPVGLTARPHTAPTFGVFVARPVSMWVAPN